MFRSRWAATRSRSRSRSKRRTEQEQQKDDAQANVQPLQLLPLPGLGQSSALPSSPATIHGFPSYESGQQQQWDYGLSTTPPYHHYHHARPCHSVQDLLLMRDEGIEERWARNHPFNVHTPPLANGSPPPTAAMAKKQSLPVLPPLPSVSPFGTTPPRGSSSATGYGQRGSSGVDISRVGSPRASPRAEAGTSAASSPLPPEQPTDSQRPSPRNDAAMQLSINAQGHMSIHAAPNSTPTHQHTAMPSVDSITSPVVGTGFALNKTLPPSDGDETTARCAAGSSGTPQATLSSRLEQKTKKLLSKITKSPVLRRFAAKGSPTSQDDGKTTPTVKRSRHNTEASVAPLNRRHPAGTTSTCDLPHTATDLSSGGGGATANAASNSRQKIGRKGSAQGTTLSTSSISLPLHLVAVPHPNPQWQRLSTRNDSRLSMLHAGAAGDEHGTHTDSRHGAVVNHRQSQVSLASVQTTLTHDATASPGSPSRLPPSPTPPVTARTSRSPSNAMPPQWKRDSIRGHMDYYRPGSASKRVEMSRGSLLIAGGPSRSQPEPLRVNTHDVQRLPSRGGSSRDGQRTPSRGGREDKQRVPSRSGPTPTQRLPSRGSATGLSPRPSTGNMTNSPPPSPFTPRDGSMEVMESSPSTLQHRRSGRVSQPSPSPGKSRARRDALSAPASSPLSSPLKSRPNSQISVLSILPATNSRTDDNHVKEEQNQNDEEERMWRSPVSRKSSQECSPIAAPPSSPVGLSTPSPFRFLFPSHSASAGSAPDAQQQTSSTKLPTTWIELEPSNADPSLIETRTSNRPDLYIPSHTNSTATLTQDLLAAGCGTASDDESDSDSAQIVNTADIGYEPYDQGVAVERRAVHPYAYMRNHAHSMAVEEHSHWSADTTSQQSEQESSGNEHEQSNSNSSSDPTSERTVKPTQEHDKQHSYNSDAFRESFDETSDSFNAPRPAPSPPVLNGNVTAATDDMIAWPSSSASSYRRMSKNDSLLEQPQQYGGVGHYPTHLSSSAHSYVRRPSMQTVSATRSLSPLGPGGRGNTASPSGTSSFNTPTPSRMPTPMPWSSVRARASVLSSTSVSTATPTRGS